MARRGMTGQMNMFDFFRELETNIPQDGELEMVSLMPNFEEDEIPPTAAQSEPVTEVVKEVVKEAEVAPMVNKDVSMQEGTPVSSVKTDTCQDRPVMQRTYTTKQGIVEIAYMNYSKVRVSLPGEDAQIMEFTSSKEAVDYYVEQMQKLEELYKTDN